MTSWFSTGRPDITEAVVAACARVDETIKRDVELAKQELEEAQQENRANLVQISQLRRENDVLKDLLRQAEANIAYIQCRSPPSGTADRPGDKLLPAEPDWKSECARVSLKFHALSENFKKAKDALRKRKDERDKWAEYSGLLKNKIKAAEEEHGISIMDRGNRSTHAAVNPEIKAEANPSPNTSFVSDAGLDQADLELPPLAAESLSSGRNSDAASKKVANPHSDSTQGETETRGSDDLPELPPTDEADEVQIKAAPSSDQPVFVSERAVRKRKRNGPEPNETPTRKIKSEPDDGSSPLAITRQNTSNLQESIDLGELAQKMSTPRKRREVEASTRGEAPRNDLDVFDAATTTPVPLYVRPDAVLQPQTARPPARNSALTPLSVNRRVAQSGGDKPRFENQPAPVKRGLSRGILSLAEDGGVYKRGSSGRVRDVEKPEKPVPKGRLDALLNSRSISDDEQPTRSPRPRARASLADDLLIPGRRELPFEREKRAKETPSTEQRNISSKLHIAGARTLAEETRSPLARKGLLRNKPLSELRPDDFKINPLANDGHDFAYTEVVRDKDSRAELSGCTDMNCCGKTFRDLAISQRPNPPLTPTQRQEEQKLLEGYLGELAYRLPTMDKVERDELWVEAKMHELAKKHSKHRHRYSRMQSPPGFWNPDFPSTQELETERAEAAKREQRTVQERYREAMRPGGTWLFRDEQGE